MKNENKDPVIAFLKKRFGKDAPVHRMELGALAEAQKQYNSHAGSSKHPLASELVISDTGRLYAIVRAANQRAQLYAIDFSPKIKATARQVKNWPPGLRD